MFCGGNYQVLGDLRRMHQVYLGCRGKCARLWIEAAPASDAGQVAVPREAGSSTVLQLRSCGASPERWWHHRAGSRQRPSEESPPKPESTSTAVDCFVHRE